MAFEPYGPPPQLAGALPMGAQSPLPGAAPPVEPPPPPVFHDVTILTKKTYGCAKVVPVPPEEFGISRSARSIHDAIYCMHRVEKPEWELISQGYDPEQIKELPTFGPDEQESSARDSVNESDVSDELNHAARMVRITEHYIRLDMEGNNQYRLYKITTGAEGGEILSKKNKEGKYQDDIEEMDVMPFAAMTPVPITHRFFGRSVADLVMDIQKIKTALIRGFNDNLYQVTMPRPVVNEQGSNENTLDDLLTWRHGDPIRTRLPGAVEFQTVMPVGQHVLPAIQYWDTVREWRTGVSRQGQGVDPNALQNQVATIANQMQSAADKKMRMIARIFAETGIRDMFILLHGMIQKNDRQENVVRLRGKWETVDPRQWKTRTDMTINVGLGTGNKQMQLQQFMLIAQAQEKAVMAPELSMVSRDELFNAAEELCRLTGYKDPERFFKAPGPDNPPGQPKPDPKMMELELKKQELGLKGQEVQGKMEVEKVQAQADIAVNDRKVNAEIMMMDKEFQLKKELALFEAGMQQQTKRMELAQNQQEHQANMAFERESRQTDMAFKAQDRQMDMMHNERAARQNEDITQRKFDQQQEMQRQAMVNKPKETK